VRLNTIRFLVLSVVVLCLIAVIGTCADFVAAHCFGR
jgi:hypothetical protein